MKSDNIYVDRYNNIIFDNDGVLINSNKIKENNIKLVVEKYTDKITSDNFVNEFIRLSGIPREIKVQKYFSPEIASKILTDYNALNYKTLYSAECVDGIKSFLDVLLKYKRHLYVLSGGDEKEVKSVLAYKQLLNRFSGVRGGPLTKSENLKAMNLSGKLLYFGDSEVDYDLAVQHQMDFVFVYENTVLKEWPLFFKAKKVLCIKNFTELEPKLINS